MTIYEHIGNPIFVIASLHECGDWKKFLWDPPTEVIISNISAESKQLFQEQIDGFQICVMWMRQLTE